MTTKAERLNQAVDLIIRGMIPRELHADAILMCEEEPPAWRVLKRRKWLRAVNRMIAWTRGGRP